MTIRGLQRLLMILGGKVAAEFREIVEGVFTRYMAGDTSLIEEIRDNAASDAPVNVMARTALEQEPVTLGKRKQIDELDFAERAENLRRTRVETVCKFAEVMSMLDADWKDDTRLVQQTKDFCKNGLLTQQLQLQLDFESMSGAVSCQRHRAGTSRPGALFRSFSEEHIQVGGRVCVNT